MYQQLAKTELHCHLDGSLSLSAIRQLAQLAEIDIPESDQELRSLVTAPEHCQNLMDYLKTFDVIRPLLQTQEALELAAYDVARQQAEENVIYSEIRFAPELSMDQGLTASQTVKAVLAGLQRAHEEFGIVSKTIVCGMRQSNPELTWEILSEVADLAPQGLAGFDFAGDEHAFPPAKIEKLIKKVQELGYPLTLHAGECGCPHHIVQTLELGIKRMGHAAAITHHPEIITEFVGKGATAELCLTSNLQTKAVPSLVDYPYQELLKAGAKITINTDNRTVSDTNLTKEYELFNRYFATSSADFLTFNQNAISAAFINQEEKEYLSKKLEEAYQPYL
ncbi:adenosine deaminase [Streptococcus criceti]|uniref:Adenosine deaminase n=1 Tax=Streptococcus criceti HS-6 TaxID=873449 RepID=G5JR78_STRCG|nr:adenosine deaminase [Streptococcus criceti]EHI75136.1 adenosine deaminase family protein [Streptococcus criceti HS-6]SUN42951.1 adenosine deaminase [Streptococcus criceti]